MKDAEADDFLLSSYDYELPASSIAQFPCAERGASRLMLLPGNLPPVHAMFRDLPDLLPPRSLLVANNSRVQPARLAGKRPGGGMAEFLLLTPIDLVSAQTGPDGCEQAVVDGLIRPAARIRPGASLAFAHGLEAEILAKGGFGQCQARLRWRGSLEDVLAKAGRLPLPPYIKRQPRELDASRYQTVYASRPGSVAAPTAGLHFTQAMRRALAAGGHEWTELSLHVGYGTFSPVRARDIRAHKMHAEYAELAPETCAAIARAKQAGRPVIAVGTTSLRALEGITRTCGSLRPYAGFVNIFIYPGFEFRVADGLITNFHLPGSTLLMLVSALAGRGRVLAAYAEAVRDGYRFFSYGDAMLVLRENVSEPD